MPDISEAVRKDIEQRLAKYLKSRAGYHSPTYLASGGSAATYSIETPVGRRAIKVYDPKFLAGTFEKASLRRLQLQKDLIGHSCVQLVSMYEVALAEDTAFIEMEFVKWPRLKDVLTEVPDESVPTLVRELVTAVTFLEKQDIVHRDIKPENIHVSLDFKNLKLLDLGIVRGIDVIEEDSGEGTDQGSTRPFIATAQYSSPEYLFRLDEPSANLWKALNLYQVGAVLHDLINKRALFQDEVEKDNRWLVARAVLDKTPTFPDTNPARLAREKALAHRCLAKDASTRLMIAGWSDFNFDSADHGIATLQAKLSKVSDQSGAQSLIATEKRLDFERKGLFQRLGEKTKTELISACGGKIPLFCYADDLSATYTHTLDFTLGKDVKAKFGISLKWGSGLHGRTAAINLSCMLLITNDPVKAATSRTVTVVTIDESEEVAFADVANNVAGTLAYAIDLVEANDSSSLHGVDIGEKFKQGTN